MTESSHPMPDRLCPGPCNRRPHATETAAQRPGEPIWCPACARRIHAALNALPALYEALRADALHGTRPRLDRVTGSRGDHSPAPAVDDAVDLAHWLAGWQDRALTVAGYSPIDRAGWTIDAILDHALRTLTAPDWFDWITAHDEIAEPFGRDILDQHARLAARTAYVAPYRPDTRVPCPACDRIALAHFRAGGHVRCRYCDYEMTDAEYRLHALRHLGRSGDAA